MCSIANLFDRNIRKFDAKKLYFLPKMLKLHNPPVPPSPFIKKGEGDCVFEIFEKIEGSDFSHR